MMTLRDRLHNFPPCLVRILARHKSGGPLDIHEIADNTRPRDGASWVLSPSEVLSISKHPEWEYLSMVDAIAFFRGCGLDLDDPKAWRREADYLRKRPTFRYLRSDERWAEYWKPLLLKWRDTATPTWGPLVELQRRLKT